MLSSKLKNDLNPQQLEAVTASEGPVLIIAGAGTGKTRTLTYRFAYLVDSGVPLDRILLCTFTNKAAREMILRAQSILQTPLSDLWAGTFHRIANRFLRIHHKYLQLPQNFSILDTEDSTQLIRHISRENKYSQQFKRFPSPKVLRELFSMSKATGFEIPELIAELYPHFEELCEPIEEIFDIYHQKKSEIGAVDFDDLLDLWYQLLMFPEIQERYAEHFLHILIDEYQDTNPLQAQIVDTLALAHRNITVVGDDAQSIYRFRGAEPRNILNFPHRYPDCQTFYLTVNYRSTPQILNAANLVIAQNRDQFPKELESIREPGPPLEILLTRSNLSEAQLVVGKIKELAEDYPLSEIAVLYRAHSQSLELQVLLQREGIPFVVRSGPKFFEQAHIKDLLAWLRIFANPTDTLAWQRILPIFKDIGAKTTAEIIALLAGYKFDLRALLKDEFLDSLSTRARSAFGRILPLFRDALTETSSEPRPLMELFLKFEYEEYLKFNYENAHKRLEDIYYLFDYAENYEDLAEFLAELTLQSEFSSAEDSHLSQKGGDNFEESDYLVLSSIHQAKGLEWEAVICIHAAEGTFPLFFAMKEREDLEEERRLFYVAATRAKTHLIFSVPILRSSSGYLYSEVPSRFIWEMLDIPFKKGRFASTLRKFIQKARKNPDVELYLDDIDDLLEM